MHAKLPQSCLTLHDEHRVDCSPPRLLCPWHSPGKNIRVGCHVLLQGNLPDSGIKPTSLISPALAGRFFTTSATWEALSTLYYFFILMIQNLLIPVL